MLPYKSTNMTNMDVDLGGIFVQNSTFNYEDYVYEMDCEPDTFSGIFIPVLYSLALAVGLPGLGILLSLVVRKRQNWSVMDIFTLHLGVVDGLLLVTLPFWTTQAAQHRGWTFGTALCKIIGAVFHINFYCGIFLLACISLDRYLSIVHATQMYSRRKPWLVQASCLSVWLFSLLLSIPDWAFFEAVKDSRKGKTECILFYPPDSQWLLASRLIFHIGGFILPSVILIFCYTRILLRCGPWGFQKLRAVRVILVLVVVFFICWMPYNITLMIDTFQNKSQLPQESESGSCGKFTSFLERSVIVTPVLCCFHACLNPLLYFGLCQNFRKGTLEMLRCVLGVEADPRHSLWEFSIRDQALPGESQEKEELKQTTGIEQKMESN